MPHHSLPIVLSEQAGPVPGVSPSLSGADSDLLGRSRGCKHLRVV